MLLGQLYLVTVIGVLVGNFAGRSRRAAELRRRRLPHLSNQTALVPRHMHGPRAMSWVTTTTPNRAMSHSP